MTTKPHQRARQALAAGPGPDSGARAEGLRKEQSITTELTAHVTELPDAYPVVFQTGDPPRTGRMVFWDVAGGESLTVLARDGEAIVRRTAPARGLPLADVLPALVSMPQDHPAHPAVRFWAAACRVALHMVARGRILPGISPDGYDAWRAGPLESDDAVRLRALADAMPPEARAVPLPGTDLLPDAATLVRAFCDAVADVLPRTPAA
ncbi:MAG: hypothetical protein ACRDTU_18565, partial [Micromonosporaceae bacterium]